MHVGTSTFGEEGHGGQRCELAIFHFWQLFLINAAPVTALARKEFCRGAFCREITFLAT
jgi:hypothetical protein